MKKTFFYFIFSLLIVGCDASKDDSDKTVDIDKTGSIATKVSVTHLDTWHDLYTLESTVWVNGAIAKTSVHYDTFPGLGMIKEELTDKDENDTTIVRQRAFNIYLTVQ